MGGIELRNVKERSGNSCRSISPCCVAQPVSPLGKHTQMLPTLKNQLALRKVVVDGYEFGLVVLD